MQASIAQVAACGKLKSRGIKRGFGYHSRRRGLNMEELLEFTRKLGDLAEVETKHGRSTKRLRAEASEFLIKRPSQEGNPALEGLAKAIIEGFEAEMERDARRRADHPNLNWGPSYRQQMVESRKDPRFRRELEDIRKANPKLSLKQVRILAFVRCDRILTEKLEEGALGDGQKLLSGFHVASPAASLNVNIDRHKIMYREAARRNAMIQTNGYVARLMKEAEGA